MECGAKRNSVAPGALEPGNGRRTPENKRTGAGRDERKADEVNIEIERQNWRTITRRAPREPFRHGCATGFSINSSTAADQQRFATQIPFGCEPPMPRTTLIILCLSIDLKTYLV